MPDQTEDQQSLVDAFNHAHHIGYPVRYWTGEREGDGKISTTRTAAQLLGGHTAVVWVDGEASCIALTHVDPLPDQPDGIEADSRDLPDPATAAERVNQFICATGDGLYDIQDGAPLYARDLEALTRVPTKLADAKEDLARTIDEADQLRRELGITRTEADRAIADLRQVDGLLSDVVVTLEDWLHDTAADGTPIEHLLNRIRHGLREGTAPVPGSSRRVQDVQAQGYAEAVARLRDDDRYRNWWSPRNDKPTRNIRLHLADYLETVGPDGIDVESGRWPAREHAVVRAAIAWRNGEEVDRIGVDDLGLALIEAVDALPHAGESQASEPAPAVGCCPMGTATGTGHEPFCRHRLAGTVPAAPKLATGGIIRRDQAAIVGEQTDGCVVPAERPIDLDDRTPRPVNPFACNKCGCFCGGSHG